MAQAGFATRSVREDRMRLTAECASAVRSVTRDLFGGYRPERHYMRGPGPKWHEKHDRDVVVDVSPLPGALTAQT